MDGGIPCDVAGCVASGTNVIYGADIAAVKAEARAVLEHVTVARVGER